MYRRHTATFFAPGAAHQVMMTGAANVVASIKPASVVPAVHSDFDVQGGGVEGASMHLSQLRWFRVSDQHVERVSEQEVLACEAAALFYERRC